MIRNAIRRNISNNTKQTVQILHIMGTVKLAVAKTSLCIKSFVIDRYIIYLNRVIVMSMMIKMYQYKSHSGSHVSNFFD